jgi:hypothetical protein
MSTPELSGSWIYRSYNPTYVLGAAPEREDSLILTDADLNLEHRTRPTTLEGTIEWPGRSGEKEGLVLQGWVLEGELRGFELMGTGRPGTPTSGWEYRYYGHKLPIGHPYVATVVDVLGGSVLRAKTHGDSKAGEVFPIIAVRKQPFLPPSDQPFLTSEFAGLWTYRRFGNKADTTPIYKTAPQNAYELILQEADLKLETPTNWWTLQGTIEWPGRGLLDLKGGLRRFDPPYRARREGEPTDYLQDAVGFEIVGTGRPGSDTAGWEYHYRGYLTRQWPNAQRFQALVGSAIRAKPDGEAAPAVAPFIALKR